MILANSLFINELDQKKLGSISATGGILPGAIDQSCRYPIGKIMVDIKDI